jgi:outer membrane protein OmpA-like peptidoglycan-associated protein
MLSGKEIACVTVRCGVTKIKRISALLLCAGWAIAQVPNPTQNVPQSERPGAGNNSGAIPVYRITVVSRTTAAINYRHRSGETNIDFRGTELLPQSHGKAQVKSQKGYADIDAKFENMDVPGRFGPEYLTYVLWAVTPEGRATNLGEVVLDGRHGKLHVTSDLQAFGLIVTAEPYFAVTQPSDVVVMENIVRQDTTGRIETIDAKYELLRRGQYTFNAANSVSPAVTDPKAPLEIREARNALQIAIWSGADRYATDTLNKAQVMMGNAEGFNSHKGPKKDVISIARQVVQTAEDARIIAIRKQDEEHLAQERQASAAREARSKADAQAAAEQQRLEAQRRAQAEADRARAESDRARADADRVAAERAKADAEALTQRARAEADAISRQAAEQRAAAEAARLAAQADADKAKAEADAARQAALAEQQKAQADAERARQQIENADKLRQQAIADRENLREQLRQQLNTVLETRETARGLIVNMSDVLFDTGKYTLKPGAREKLARVAGIVVSHPGLALEVEGHTDNVGGDEYNQRLSEQRAAAVRDFLGTQGLSATSIMARGFGKMQPVVSNDTAAGRQRNRRVELVVSGEPIGRQSQGSVSSMPARTPRQ